MNNLRYNQVSMKASHNSYQRDETITEQISCNSEKNYDCCCGGLELDISQSDDGLYWSVGHLPSYHKDYRQLSSFLRDLMVWSNSNPLHDVITLYLDIKHTTTDDFPNQLDKYIKECFLVDIFSPGELMTNNETLSQAVLDNGGLPYLEELKGKFIICLTGNISDKEKYAATSLKERLCFSDKDTNCNEMPSDDNRIFFNFHIYHLQRDDWMEIFKKCALSPNVIIRAYIANSKENWDDCLSSGCNLIATDKICNYQWAKVGDSRFVKKSGL